MLSSPPGEKLAEHSWVQIFDMLEVFETGEIINTLGTLDIGGEWIYQNNTLSARKVAQYFSFI